MEAPADQRGRTPLIGHALARAKTVATMAKIAGARWREHASGALMAWRR